MGETAALAAVAAAAPPITSADTLLGRRKLPLAIAFRAPVSGCRQFGPKNSGPVA